MPSKVYDLTPKIHSGLAVFPGDVSFQRKVSFDFLKGDHLLLSSVQSTLHLGAHADSSSHYHVHGKGIDASPLTAYFGTTQVIRVETKPGQRIQISDLKDRQIQAPRILFSTGSFPDPDHWNSDFMSLSPDLIRHLHKKGCVLVGIDTPSVDPENSKNLESHQALYETQIAVLEGLVLEKVPEGIYSLVALPLPIQNADASPVRALLFEDANLFLKQDYQII